MGSSQPSTPRRRRWTRKELYRLLDLGFFHDQRIELIAGAILEMPRLTNFQALGITLTAKALRGACGADHWDRTQASLDLNRLSVLAPDLAVVPGAPRSHAGKDNPSTALLVVEVSETTLRLDRRRKGSLYARSGISDYWILNLVDRHLEVYRDPVPDSAQIFGHGYSSHTILQATDTVSPLAAPNATILVADLLP